MPFYAHTQRFMPVYASSPSQPLMPLYAHTDMFTDMFSDMGDTGVGDVDAMGDTDGWVTRMMRVRRVT